MTFLAVTIVQFFWNPNHYTSFRSFIVQNNHFRTNRICLLLFYFLVGQANIISRLVSYRATNGQPNNMTNRVAKTGYKDNQLYHCLKYEKKTHNGKQLCLQVRQIVEEWCVKRDAKSSVVGHTGWFLYGLYKKFKTTL